MNQNANILGITALFSALAHATVILGVSFIYPELGKLNKAPNSLDVVLVNKVNSRQPEDSQLVSNQNNAGGGVGEQQAVSPLEYKIESNQTLQAIKLRKQQAISQIAPDQFVTTKRATVRLQSSPSIEELRESFIPQPGEDPTETLAPLNAERERLMAKLDQRWQTLQKRPKREYLSPATAQHETAQYLDKWRKRIEQVGNANFPDDAIRRSLSGSLILTVEIHRSGELGSVVINQASEHDVLNRSAIQFVQQAAPFARFPAEIDEGTDILVITRAFHFLENRSVSSSDTSVIQ